MGLPAVGAGGLHEHHHSPGLDFAVHELLSHADSRSPRDLPARTLSCRYCSGVNPAGQLALLQRNLPGGGVCLAACSILKGQPESQPTPGWLPSWQYKGCITCVYHPQLRPGCVLSSDLSGPPALWQKAVSDYPLGKHKAHRPAPGTVLSRQPPPWSKIFLWPPGDTVWETSFRTESLQKQSASPSL